MRSVSQSFNREMSRRDYSGWPRVLLGPNPGRVIEASLALRKPLIGAPLPGQAFYCAACRRMHEAS